MTWNPWNRMALHMTTLRKLIAVCTAILVMTPTVTVGGSDQPYAYAPGKRFLEWPSASRIDYVIGVLDALSYITETAGVQRGLSACLKENVMDTNNPVTWQLVAKDAVVEATAKGDAASVSVTEQLFEKMKIVCRNHYPEK